jgi:hypothetical protein
MTVFQWSRASDYIGRKPVLLLGVFGLSISMFCFGLSRTFTGLVLRYACLAHLAVQSHRYWSPAQPLYHWRPERQHRRYEEHVRGTDGPYEHGSGVRLVTHSLVSRNDAWVSMITRTFSYAFELTICSPVIGGTLARPQDNFPRLFSSPFWGDFPYFLPCGVTAGFSLLTFGAILLFLKEVSSLDILIS